MGSNTCKLKTPLQDFIEMLQDAVKHEHYFEISPDGAADLLKHIEELRNPLAQTPTPAQSPSPLPNPTIYVTGAKGELDAEFWTVASNFDWIKDRAVKDAETCHSTRVVYKLVPVLEVSLEVTTKILTKDLSTQPPPPDDRRDWDEADRIERERERIRQS